MVVILPAACEGTVNTLSGICPDVEAPVASQDDHIHTVGGHENFYRDLKEYLKSR